MESKLAKIQSFVESLEINQLSEKQQMTLVVNSEDVMGGTGQNGKSCSNQTGCGGSINDKKCINGSGSCSGALNGLKCTNT